MKQIKIIKTAFLILLMFSSIGQIFSQTETLLRIDPTKAYGGNFSEYFDSVEYIPLETNKESLFGYITQMVITDSSIIVADFDTQAVLFFNKKGKFLTKIKMPGNNFSPLLEYDRVNNYLTIRTINMALSKGEERNYSMMGKLLDKIPINKNLIERPNLIHLEDDYFLNLQNCYIPDNVKPSDSLIYQAEIYKKDSLYNSFLPVIQKEKITACAFSSIRTKIRPPLNDGAVYMATPLEHEIYRITKDTAIKIYEIIFPADWSFSKQIMESKNFKFIDSLRKAKAQNKKVVLSVSDIFKIGDLLFFRIITRNNTFSFKIGYDDTYNFIYNLKTGKYSCIERIHPDATNGYLPFYSWDIMMWGLNYNENDAHFYTSVSSLEMFNAHEKNKDKNPELPASTIGYFKTQDRKSNPVVVRFKLKK